MERGSINVTGPNGEQISLYFDRDGGLSINVSGLDFSGIKSAMGSGLDYTVALQPADLRQARVLGETK